MLDAANTSPSRTPRMMAPMLNSLGASLGGTYGRNAAASVVCWGMVMGRIWVGMGRRVSRAGDAGLLPSSRPVVLASRVPSRDDCPRQFHQTRDLHATARIPLRPVRLGRGRL